MKRKIAGDDLFKSSSALQILAYLIDRPGADVLPGEIEKDTGISRVGIYLALRKLWARKLISKRQRGRFVTYTAVISNPVVRQYKIMNNISRLEPDLAKLQACAKKIILFGSVSRGEDYPDSDIDLFILTQNPQAVVDLLSKIKTKRKLQAVIKTPSEFTEFAKKNPAFNREIERGIVIWEETI